MEQVEIPITWILLYHGHKGCYDFANLPTISQTVTDAEHAEYRNGSFPYIELLLFASQISLLA